MYNKFLITLKLQGRFSVSLPNAVLEAGRLVWFEENERHLIKSVGIITFPFVLANKLYHSVISDMSNHLEILYMPDKYKTLVFIRTVLK